MCHVDSGVRVDHPDLAGNVLKGWNFVPAGQVRPTKASCGALSPVQALHLRQGSAALPLAALGCPGPWTWTCRAPPPLPIPAYGLQVDGTPPPQAGTPDYFNYNDTYGHGTHTAGIIGAVSRGKGPAASGTFELGRVHCRWLAFLVDRPLRGMLERGSVHSLAQFCCVSACFQPHQLLHAAPLAAAAGWQQPAGHRGHHVAGEAARLPLHLERWLRLCERRDELHQAVQAGGRAHHVKFLGRHRLLE